MGIFEKAKEIAPGLMYKENRDKITSLCCANCSTKMRLRKGIDPYFECPSCGETVEYDMAAYYAEDQIEYPYEDVYDDE